VVVQRLSALDSSFLCVESPSAHMHVGWLATVLPAERGEPLDGEALAERIAARLHLAPRFRQRVVGSPLGEPAWVDDPAFRLERHVRIQGGPALERAELAELAGDFLSRQLGRHRPLWEIEVIPALSDGRAAVLGKVHHAMVDGIAAVELGTLLFDLAPDAALPDPVDWEPSPAVGALGLATDAVMDSAVEQFRAARRVAALGLQPRRSLRVAETMRRAALSIAEDVVRPARPSFLNAEIGPRRALITERVGLGRLDRIKRARGVKLNDIVLAIVAGALRRFATARREEPAALRAMVPVSVRGEDESGGNRITFAFLDLPLDEPSAIRRLALVHERTQELKRSGRIAGSEAILRGAGQLPGFLKERAARMAASPRLYNVTVSNVPGPRMSLYAAGNEVESIYPVIPITDGHTLAIGVLTYRDAVHFACYVDPEALTDAPELATLIRSSLRELERECQRKGETSKRRRAPAEHGPAKTPQPSQRGSSKPAYS
jgi:WS/DGAT/MGAT family acyltransferase